MSFICITNNKSLQEKYDKEFDIHYYDVSLLEILIKARDMAHKGHKILTHPLSGSVKPGETTVKTIFLSGSAGRTDIDSIVIIENSIMACGKFVNKNISYERSRQDFEAIDLSLAESAIAAMYR